MFPMYRGKRQSKTHKTQNRLVLGPRRRRDLAPHEGQANAENEPPALMNEEPLDDDDSYEAPVVPSKAGIVEKSNKDEQVIGDTKAEDEKMPASGEKKTNVEEKVVAEKSLNPPTLPQAQEYSSNENSQNLFCNNFILPLTRTTEGGVNYYNMSVSVPVFYLNT